jgi:phosphopantetheinyl transferase
LHFISYLGIYPQGTIVELNSGEVGIVLGTNQTQRLRPQILIVRNSAKHPTEAFVDLAEKTIDDKGRPYRISHVCKPGDFGINLSHYSELLLESFK